MQNGRYKGGIWSTRLTALKIRVGGNRQRRKKKNTYDDL